MKGNYEDMPECLYETGIKKNPLLGSKNAFKKISKDAKAC